ncbi:MAG: hypothetical protein IT428_15345 [Planctomycetaceae bacterium]|nr:hypothetical protein [Planctomycetaceae bacterium]
MQSHRNRMSQTFVLMLGVAAMSVGVTGCERKERVVDVEAPGIRIKVDRDKDSGAVDVNVDREKK